MDEFEKMSDDQIDQLLAQRFMETKQSDPQDNFENMSDDQIDDLLAQKVIGQQSPQQNQDVEAFVQGFGNSATLGYLPQIQAATEPFIQGALDFFNGENQTDKNLKERGFEINAPKKSYLERRDSYLNEADALSRENPEASFAGNVAGSIAGGISTGGGLGKLLGLGKTAGIAGRLKQAATTGAAVGAIRNPGDTEGELSPIQPTDRLKNIAQDAATGLVFQGGLEGIGKAGNAIKNSASSLRNYSETKALKASGAMLKDMRRAFSKKQIGSLGNEIIDSGIVGYGDDIADISAKAKSAVDESSANLDRVYQLADQAVEESIGPIDFKVRLNNVADKLRSGLKERYADNIDGEEIIASVTKELDKVGDKKNLTFGELRNLRKSIDEKINFSKAKMELPALQKELLDLRNGIQDEIKNKLGKLSPELEKAFIEENSKLSKRLQISSIAQDKLARESSNAAFGLRERLAGQSGTVAGGIIGTAIGGPVGTAVGAAVGSQLNSITTKVARQYGTPFVALTANKVARSLENNPQMLGKFSDQLIKAASVSPEKFVTTVNLLMKKPGFKRQIKDLPGNINSMPAIGKKKQSFERNPSGE